MADSKYTLDTYDDYYTAELAGMNTRDKQLALFNSLSDAIALATIENKGALSSSQLKAIIGEDNYAWYRDDQFNEIYNTWYNKYGAELLDPTSEAVQSLTSKQTQGKLQQMQPTLDALAESLGLFTSSDQQGYQDYLNVLNAATDAQYSAAMNELDYAENQMLRSIGLSQRQTERDIAKRRQQALKSGMSTAQLAAQEQQNILAAQTGATQLAQQYADQRYSTINQFAGVREQNAATAMQQGYSNANVLGQIYQNLYAADKYDQ